MPRHVFSELRPFTPRNRLFQLPNGTVIDPRSILAMEARQNLRPFVDADGNQHHAQLLIETGMRIYRVPCPNLREAQFLRDHLVSKVSSEAAAQHSTAEAAE